VTSSVDTASLFVVVSNALVPSVTISPDTIVCPGAALTLNANTTNCGTTPMYQWFTNGLPIAGANASTYSFNVTPPDTAISVGVNSSLSCVTTPFTGDTTIVHIYQNIVASASLSSNPNGAVCAGDSITYSASTQNGGAAPIFQWYLNGVLTPVTDSVFTVFPSNGDSIRVQLTSGIACASVPVANASAIATVSPAVSPSVTVTTNPSSTICLGDSVTLNAQATNAGNPSYAWTVNGNPAGVNDSILTLSTVNNNDVIRVIVNSSLSCAPISSDTVQVTMTVLGNVSPSVSISLTGTPVCENEPVQLVASGINSGTNPAIQCFINGTPTGINNDTILLNTLKNGDTVLVSMTSSINCVSSTGPVSAIYVASLQPRVTPDISVTAQPADSVCIGQQVHLQANITQGGTNPQIRWYVNGMLSTNTGPSFYSNSFGYGDIIVANLISSERCLMQPIDTSNFIRIVYRKPLHVNLTSGLLGCAGVSTIITAHPSGGTSGPYHLYWNNGSVDTTRIEIAPGRNSEVIVQVQDNCTNQPAYDTLKVPILSSPLADFTFYNPYEGAFLNTVQFINQSLDADSWIWFFPDSNTTSTDLNPKHTFPGKGTYAIKLFTLNNSGCFDSIIYTINVNEQPAVFYPNSFTPNGDGNNDFFQPLGAKLRYDDLEQMG
jgi:PKD repeat protein